MENRLLKDKLSKLPMPSRESEPELETLPEEDSPEIPAEDSPLAAISDDELIAEFKARGLSLEETPEEIPEELESDPLLDEEL